MSHFAPRVVVAGELVMRAARRERLARHARPRACPDSIALWLPLMRGTLTKPAAQPISAPPGNVSFGTD